jgi:hypothetical protein
MQSEQKMIQMMPSDGWRVALVECDFEEGLRLFEEPLVGWALIEDGAEPIFLLGNARCGYVGAACFVRAGKRLANLRRT